MTRMLARQAGRYGRQSKDSKKSVEQQLAEQAADLTEIGAELKKTYTDGVSASKYTKQKRDDWPKLLADIRNGVINLVSLWESSRGSRKLGEWVEFLDLCEEHDCLIRVKTHGRTYSMANHRDRRTLAEDGVDSEYESNKNSERIRRDVRANAVKGRPGGRLLYGYTRDYDEKGNFVRQYEHPVQGPIVSEIATRVADGEAPYSIAKDLNERGIPTPGMRSGENEAKHFNRSVKKSWHNIQITRICNNREYLGLRVHKGDEYQAVWPALFDEDTWRKAQDYLEHHATSGQYPKAKYLASMIAKCGVCGSPLIVKHNGPLYYTCKAKFCVSIKQTELDEYLNEEMRELMFSLDVKEENNPEEAEQRQLARNELDQVQADLDQFVKDAFKHKTSAKAIAIYEEQANARIAELNELLKSPRIPKYVYEYEQNPELWDTYNLEQKRDLLRSLVEVRVAAVGKGYGYFGGQRPPGPAERVTVDQVATMGYWVPASRAGRMA